MRGKEAAHALRVAVLGRVLLPGERGGAALGLGGRHTGQRAEGAGDDEGEAPANEDLPPRERCGTAPSAGDCCIGSNPISSMTIAR